VACGSIVAVARVAARVAREARPEHGGGRGVELPVPDRVVGGQADRGDKDLEGVGVDEDGVVAARVGAEDEAVVCDGGYAQPVGRVADLDAGLLLGSGDIALVCVGQLEVMDRGEFIFLA
jgi:hypothetical protein